MISKIFNDFIYEENPRFLTSLSALVDAWNNNYSN